MSMGFSIPLKDSLKRQKYMVLIVQRKGRGRMKKKKKTKEFCTIPPTRTEGFLQTFKKSGAVGIRLGGVH